jgi:hypothetical protein
MRPATHTIDLPASPLERASEVARFDWSLPARSYTETSISEDQRSAMPRAVRLVGLLAFGQSLIFLSLWLLICARAGAAPAKTAEFSPDLQLSTYQPTKSRDPISRAGATSLDVKSVPGAAAVFQLDGILYQHSNPSAVVNGQLVTLNKTVTLTVGNGQVSVRAVEITRDAVTLEVGGQKVELRLAQQDPSRSNPR